MESSINEKESMNIKVSEAAKVLGKSKQFVRIGLQRDILPIGIAIQMSSKWMKIDNKLTIARCYKCISTISTYWLIFQRFMLRIYCLECQP